MHIHKFRFYILKYFGKGTFKITIMIVIWIVHVFQNNIPNELLKNLNDSLPPFQLLKSRFQIGCNL